MICRWAHEEWSFQRKQKGTVTRKESKLLAVRIANNLPNKHNVPGRTHPHVHGECVYAMTDSSFALLDSYLDAISGQSQS